MRSDARPGDSSATLPMPALPVRLVALLDLDSASMAARWQATNRMGATSVQASSACANTVDSVRAAEMGPSRMAAASLEALASLVVCSSAAPACANIITSGKATAVVRTEECESLGQSKLLEQEARTSADCKLHGADEGSVELEADDSHA